MLWYSFDDDDTFAPKAAVDAMCRIYPNATITRHHVVARAVGLPALGHHGIFRPSSQRALWPQLAARFEDSGAGAREYSVPEATRPGAD